MHVPLVYCLLPTAYCRLLPLVYCLLPAAECLLPLVYQHTSLAYCLKSISYHSNECTRLLCIVMSIVYCRMKTCLLCIADCLLSNEYTPLTSILSRPLSLVHCFFFNTYTCLFFNTYTCLLFIVPCLLPNKYTRLSCNHDTYL